MNQFYWKEFNRVKRERYKEAFTAVETFKKLTLGLEPFAVDAEHWLNEFKECLDKSESEFLNQRAAYVKGLMDQKK